MKIRRIGFSQRCRAAAYETGVMTAPRPAQVSIAGAPPILLERASMSHARLMTSRPERSEPLRAEPVTCPGCGARFALCRSEHAAIDACGFESYTFACKECGASLSGIVDPLDDALLITKLTA